MPALTRVKTPCIAQLINELGYASKPTLLRHLARIDQLAPQIDPGGIYPHDWIVFRITGYRPDINNPDLVPGDALRGDLSAIAESISESAKLTQSDIEEPCETIDSLAHRWSVSRKTIERYRRLGLIARRIDLGQGRRSIIFMSSAVEWFETLNADRLGSAARFDRISESQINQFVRWARVYHGKLGWSRSQSASRIALRSGHSHEGVRKALLRADQLSSNPIFDEVGPATLRDQLVAYRASLRGIETKVIAQRTSRSLNATQRASNNARASLLKAYSLPTKPLSSDAGDEQLNTKPATTDLLVHAPMDLRELIEQMRLRRTTVVYEERVWAGAYHALLHRAAALASTLDRAAPSSTTLDQIETNLRWATMLKSKLIEAQLNLILSTIEHQIVGPIDSLDPSRASFLLIESIRVASDAIDRFDPTHAGRIAAPVGLAITRFASRQPDIAQPVTSGKATRRIPPGHKVVDWTRILNPWSRYLMLDRRIGLILDQLMERDQIIITRRFALDGHPPCTRQRLAGLLNTNLIHAARFEQSAIRNAKNLVFSDGFNE